MSSINHLAGPWEAVLVDIHGWVYESVNEALEADDVDSDEFKILIVRDTSMPTLQGEMRRLPGHHRDGDVAHRDGGFQLVDVNYPEAGGAARLAQAQAMALGLNSAWLARA